MKRKPRDLKAADVQPKTEPKEPMPSKAKAEAKVVPPAEPEAGEASADAPVEPKADSEPAPSEWTFDTWRDRVEKTAQMNQKTIPEGTDLQALFDAGDNPWQAYLRVAK
jgi:hypothetical protein